MEQVGNASVSLNVNIQIRNYPIKAPCNFPADYSNKKQ